MSVLCAVSLFAAACSDRDGDGGSAPEKVHPVRIASFDFGESVVVSEIYAQALEARDVPVERYPGLGPREIVEPALQQDRVDLVPEYLGSALEFVTLGAGTITPEPDPMHDALGTVLGSRGLVVLPYAPGEDKNGIAVTAETADRLVLDTLSDLRGVAASMVFAGPPECPERPYCLAGLERVYALFFRDFQPVPPGSLTALALESGEADVGLVFTTDPRAAAAGLVFLEDDLGLQPAENVVPVARAEVVRRYGEALTATIDAVTARLTTEALTALNHQIELEGREPEAAARRWLRAEGLAGG